MPNAEHPDLLDFVPWIRDRKVTATARESVIQAETHPAGLAPPEIRKLSDHLARLPTGRRLEKSKDLERRGYGIIGHLLQNGTPEQIKAAQNACSARWLKAGLLTRVVGELDGRYQYLNRWEPKPLSSVEYDDVFLLLHLLDHPDGLTAGELETYARSNYHPNFRVSPERLTPKYLIGTPEKNIPLLRQVEEKLQINPEARERLAPHLEALRLMPPRPICPPEECAHAVEVAQRFRGIGEAIQRFVSSPAFQQRLISLDNVALKLFWPRFYLGESKFVPILYGTELIELQPIIIDGRLVSFEVWISKLPGGSKGRLEEETFADIPLGRLKTGSPVGHFSFEFSERGNLKRVAINDQSTGRGRSLNASIPNRDVSQIVRCQDGPSPGTEIVVHAHTGKETLMGRIFSDAVGAVYVHLRDFTKDRPQKEAWAAATVKGGQTSQATLSILGAEVSVSFSERPGNETDSLQLIYDDTIDVIQVPKRVSLTNLLDRIDKIIRRMETWLREGEELQPPPSTPLLLPGK